MDLILIPVVIQILEIIVRTSSSGDTTSGNDNPINNVERVKIIVDAAKWADLFPLANSIYSYTEFLKAVEQFPKPLWVAMNTPAAKS